VTINIPKRIGELETIIRSSDGEVMGWIQPINSIFQGEDTRKYILRRVLFLNSRAMELRKKNFQYLVFFS
jgi:hypothetical protein